jgi:hypothetical protein
MAAHCRIVDVIFFIFVGITCCQVSRFILNREMKFCFSFIHLEKFCLVKEAADRGKASQSTLTSVSYIFHCNKLMFSIVAQQQLETGFNIEMFVLCRHHLYCHLVMEYLRPRMGQQK